MDKTTVKLSDEQLVLLDGKCDEETQKQVDEAIRRIAIKEEQSDVPEKYKSFVARIVREAENNGKLIYRWERIRRCNVCLKQAGYAKYARNSGYHNRGDPNYNKPLTMQGVELAQRFVRMSGYATLGCCTDCWKEAEPYVKKALEDVKAELPQFLEGPVKYKRYDKRKCENCGWTGHEGEMGESRTVIGNGYYPSTCPSCGAVNRPLSRAIIGRVDGFVVVEA